ncbi:DUF6894 family protein [Methylobacterium brachythecii]|uniref:DUF6894 family protein n=1 Tax=Methylobacterium brachythecii TaxID=1176177 RepID=UPI003CCCF039
MNDERCAPRFHFHIYDGLTARDPNGTELPDYAAARRMALRVGGELISGDGREVKLEGGMASRSH